MNWRKSEKLNLSPHLCGFYSRKQELDIWTLCCCNKLTEIPWLKRTHLSSYSSADEKSSDTTKLNSRCISSRRKESTCSPGGEERGRGGPVSSSSPHPWIMTGFIINTARSGRTSAASLRPPQAAFKDLVEHHEAHSTPEPHPITPAQFLLEIWGKIATCLGTMHIPAGAIIWHPVSDQETSKLALRAV